MLGASVSVWLRRSYPPGYCNLSVRDYCCWENMQYPDTSAAGGRIVLLWDRSSMMRRKMDGRKNVVRQIMG